MLAAPVVLGDRLFWNSAPGISLSVFAAAILAAVVLALPARRHLAGPLALFVLAALPVAEHVQGAVGRLPDAGADGQRGLAAAGPAAGPRNLLRGRLGLAVVFPLTGLWAPVPATRAIAGRVRREAPVRVKRGNWVFPAGRAMVLGALLLQANPILADWAGQVLTGRNLHVSARTVARMLLWTGLGLLVWPFLDTPSRPRALPDPGPLRLGLTAPSVLNALVVFNAMLAVQAGVDAVYLWSGHALPPGMTHAENAHRGAYPLLATALLAGAFALSARPFLAERPVLRPLVLLWLVQNVALPLGAMYRLDRFVGACGLTCLRLHAGIWKGLAAAGLALAIGLLTAGLGLLLVRLLLRPVLALADYAAAAAAAPHRPASPPARHGTRERAAMGQRVAQMAATPHDRAATIRSYTDHVTHELKTPVSTLRAAAELLEDSPALSPADRPLVARITGAARQLQDQLDALRRVAAARETSHGGLGDLQAVLPGPVARFAGPHLTVQGGDPDLPLSRQGLGIVLGHLLDNAAQHGATSVDLAATTVPEGPVLTVADKGRAFRTATARRCSIGSSPPGAMRAEPAWARPSSPTSWRRSGRASRLSPRTGARRSG